MKITLLVVCAAWIAPILVSGKCNYPPRMSGTTQPLHRPVIKYNFTVDFEDQKAALIRQDERGFRFFDYNSKKLYEQVDGQCNITDISPGLKLPVIDPATALMIKTDKYDWNQKYANAKGNIATYNRDPDHCIPRNGCLFEYKYYFYQNLKVNISTTKAKSFYPDLSKCKNVGA